jgi:hypothetical protein
MSRPDVAPGLRYDSDSVAIRLAVRLHSISTPSTRYSAGPLPRFAADLDAGELARAAGRSQRSPIRRGSEGSDSSARGLQSSACRPSSFPFSRVIVGVFARHRRVIIALIWGAGPGRAAGSGCGLRPNFLARGLGKGASRGYLARSQFS